MWRSWRPGGWSKRREKLAGSRGSLLSTDDANDGDDDPVRDGSLTCTILILCLRTGARLAVNSSEGDGWRDSHGLVTTQESQYERHYKGGDAAVGVGFREEEDESQLAEYDDEHEVSAEDAEKTFNYKMLNNAEIQYWQKLVDRSVLYGQCGGNHTVDADADPQSPDDLLLLGLGPDDLLVEVPGDHGAGAQHGGVRAGHDGGTDGSQTKESHSLRCEILERERQNNLGAVTTWGRPIVVSQLPVGRLGDGSEEDGGSGHDESDDATSVWEELGSLCCLAGENSLVVTLPWDAPQKEKEGDVNPLSPLVTRHLTVPGGRHSVTQLRLVDIRHGLVSHREGEGQELNSQIRSGLVSSRFLKFEKCVWEKFSFAKYFMINV